LGEGSHPDPAGELAPVIEEIGEKTAIEFSAIVIGTDGDPQNTESQIEKLKEAGVRVFRTATEAIEAISLQFRAGRETGFAPADLERLGQPLAAINVGLESFYESLTSQGAQAVHVDWRPPAGGNERLAVLLQKMRK
jgi:FdrA protein